MKNSRTILLFLLILSLLVAACSPQAAPTSTPTTAPTEEPTEVPPTEEPTEEPTEVPPTEAPTDEPTEEPTEVPPTEAPTDEPTVEPTGDTVAASDTTETADEATVEATEAADEPTEEPTDEPTAEPTEAPTDEPGAFELATEWRCPDGFAGQTLNVFNWSTYIGENTIANFETLCNVTVVYDVYESNDSLIARLRTGNPGYDIVVPSDYAIPGLIGEGLLEPLNPSNIPNFGNLDQQFLNNPYDPDSRFALPYLWGTVGLGYNQSKTGEITTWEQFFAYDGPVAWTDDSRTMLAIGLLMAGKDPNSTSQEDVDAARDYLIANGDNVLVIAQDDGQELLARGEVDMAIEYNGDIVQIQVDCACEDYAYIIPEEGSGISSGFIAIPTGSQNHALAEVFIDYILDPLVGAEIANFTGYPSPNRASVEGGFADPDQLANTAIYPDAEQRSRLFFIQLDPNAEDLYSAAWDEVKIALAK